MRDDSRRPQDKGNVGIIALSIIIGLLVLVGCGIGCKMAFDGIARAYESNVNSMLDTAQAGWVAATRPTQAASQTPDGQPKDENGTDANENQPEGQNATTGNDVSSKADGKQDGKPKGKSSDKSGKKSNDSQGNDSDDDSNGNNESDDRSQGSDPNERVVVTNEHPSQEELDAHGVTCPRERVFLDSRGEWAYYVEPTDTLSNISGRFSVTVDELAEYNHIQDWDMIYDGSILRIPIYSQDR